MKKILLVFILSFLMIISTSAAVTNPSWSMPNSATYSIEEGVIADDWAIFTIDGTDSDYISNVRMSFKFIASDNSCSTTAPVLFSQEHQCVSKTRTKSGFPENDHKSKIVIGSALTPVFASAKNSYFDPDSLVHTEDNLLTVDRDYYCLLVLATITTNKDTLQVLNPKTLKLYIEELSAIGQFVANVEDTVIEDYDDPKKPFIYVVAVIIILIAYFVYIKKFKK